MCDSCGVRLPLRRLQGEHAATTFSHVVWPPRERGTIWSKARSVPSPQYWHPNLSRRNTLNRVNAGCVVGLTKDFSDTTLGSIISRDGLRTARSYFATRYPRARST